MKCRNKMEAGNLLVLHTSSNPTGTLQNSRQDLRSYNFLTLSITLSRLCCLLSIKVRAWKVFFFWSGFPGVTPERCSVAACLWYAKPIYRRCRRTVASHHNSQPQDTSCAPVPQPSTKTPTLCKFLKLHVCTLEQKVQTMQTYFPTTQYVVKPADFKVLLCCYYWCVMNAH